MAKPVYSTGSTILHIAPGKLFAKEHRKRKPCKHAHCAVINGTLNHAHRYWQGPLHQSGPCALPAYVYLDEIGLSDPKQSNFVLSVPMTVLLNLGGNFHSDPDYDVWEGTTVLDLATMNWDDLWWDRTDNRLKMRDQPWYKPSELAGSKEALNALKSWVSTKSLDELLHNPDSDC